MASGSEATQIDHAVNLWRAWGMLTYGRPPALRSARAVDAAEPAKVGPMPVRVFVSYSHKDAGFRSKLEVHLAALKREGAVQTFFDGDIHPGADLDAAIKRELRDADIFVALASPDYLNSDYCFDKEYQYALRRAGRKTMHVVVAVIRPCGWKHTRMGRYKALPEDGKEVTTWGNRDSAFEDIVTGVRRVVKLAEASQRERVPSAARNRKVKATSAKPAPAKQVKSSRSSRAKKIIETPVVRKPVVKKPAAKAAPKANVRPSGIKVATSPVRASRRTRRRKSPG